MFSIVTYYSSPHACYPLFAMMTMTIITTTMAIAARYRRRGQLAMMMSMVLTMTMMINILIMVMTVMSMVITMTMAMMMTMMMTLLLLLLMMVMMKAELSRHGTRAVGVAAVYARKRLLKFRQLDARQASRQQRGSSNPTKKEQPAGHPDSPSRCLRTSSNVLIVLLQAKETEHSA